MAAARAWGKSAFTAGDTLSAADGYATAVGLLPELAWHGLDRDTREEQLADWAGLAADAAACMIAVGQPHQAVEMLEQGRSVLWTQALHLRSDLSLLREAAPHLALRLDEIRRELDQVPSSALQGAFQPGRANVSAEEPQDWIVKDRRHLARQWDELIAQVRLLDGFEHFLAPVPFSELRASLTADPVVVVNISQIGCHALIISAVHEPGIRVLELPGISYGETFDRANAFLDVLSRASQPGRPIRDMEADRDVAMDVLEWLWSAIAEPVLEALGHTGAAADPAWPRVWWCPTGPLTVLPLHAAGRYPRRAQGRVELTETALGRVVSSYAPTLASLQARDNSARPVGEVRQLAVGMPETPGQTSLPGVSREMKALATYFPPPSRARRLVPPDATRANVLAGLADCPWVHLACHAHQDQASPSDSAFALCDGPLTVADTIESAH